MRPDGGAITIRGKPLQARSPAAARRAGLVSVYQEPALIPDLDIADNLRLTRTPVAPFLHWVRALGIEVFDSNAVDELAVYIDGADEIDGRGHMIKGGGAALTREKIVAAQSRRFVCIADASKRVEVLGAFPLPVEIIPMAARRLMRQFAAFGGPAQVREKDGLPLVTDNGQHILDVTGLKISDPLAFESEVNQWPGVVTVGVFAHQKAQVCLLATPEGVQTLRYD